MSIKMGPVLGFRGETNGKWMVCAVTVADGTLPDLEWKVNGTYQKASRAAIKRQGESIVWLDQWEVPLKDKMQKVTYKLGTPSWQFAVPPVAENRNRFRIAYTSCNGFSSPSAMKHVTNKNERWENLLKAHGKEPYHLLIMGGDQVYADSLWETRPKIKEWVNKLKRFRLAAAFTDEMKREAASFYFDLYCERWSQETIEDVLASIPTIMMWDDHDIFDGWGSYEKKMQNCPVYQGIFEQAKEHFRAFQLKTVNVPHGSVGAPGFSFAFKVGKLAIVVPDLRSERTEDRVLSPNSWKMIYTWINQNLAGCSHMLFIASIPVVYPSFAAIEAIVGTIPGEQEIEDDLRDHWTSKTHRDERTRLIHRLLMYSAQKDCRPTIVSGDVHVGASGQINSDVYTNGVKMDTVHQLVSSGIVHPPPPGVAIAFLKLIGDKVETIDPGMTSQLDPFPGTNNRFIAARNWLSLTIDDQERLWAEWFAEGEKTAFTKVIRK